MSFIRQANLVVLGLLGLCASVQADSAASHCRCIPGDACWPSSENWSELNKTVSGRLIATTPLASICHAPNYNATACAELASVWSEPQTHFPYSAEIMSPYWQNQSCNPFTSHSSPCLLGNYVDYAINVSSAADVAAGLRFAQERNVRIVVKNTGHDYNGKSTGKGALGLWMHNLRDLEFSNYSSAAYSGPAVKMGAGIQAFEGYEAASAKGLRVVGGACATVGLAGGFSQGGGHSTLSSIYGLAADQALEWEVVTANGTHLIASPTQNEDLYWAISGGGGGTYGVVLSATMKAYPDGRVGGAFMSFNTTGVSVDSFWKGVEAFHVSLPAIVDSGATVIYSLNKDSFFVVPLTAPGKTEAQVSALLEPFLTKMKTLKVPVTMSVTSYPTFIQHFNQYLGPLPYGLPLINPIDVSIAGRLVPRSIVESTDSTQDLMEALKLSVKLGGGFQTGGVAINVAHANNASDNAVLPQWRSSILQLLTFAPWSFNGSESTNLANDKYLIDVTVPALAKVAPDGGAYLNEANFQQQDVKSSFYGVNYDRLLSIKQAYDPSDLFFANSAVGSDAWVTDGDGRLCRA